MNTTKNKEDEEDIRVSAILSSMKEGLVMVDSNHKVMLVNQAASALLRIAPSEGVGQDVQKIFFLFTGKKKIPWAKSPIREALEETKTVFVQLEDDIFCRNEAKKLFPITLSATGLADYGTIGGVIIFSDMTKEKEVDRMKAEFVSVTSHQLRTPLTAIKLFIEMLGDEGAGALSAAQKNYVVNIQESTERMIHLVNDFLNMARLETGNLKSEPVPTQLEDVVENSIKEISLLANAKGCKVSFLKPSQKLPKILIDPSLMRQVLYNLITNAVKYSNKDFGRTDIELTPEGTDILISVKDNGVGIPKEVQPRIFEKFFRADNARKIQAGGSGLGLYVAKMIVEASGGEIWFESPARHASRSDGGGQEEKGTAFYVRIPIEGKKK
jgi:signal transduction histidine kinase